MYNKKQTMNQKTAVLIIHFQDSKHTIPCLNSLVKAVTINPFTTYILSIQSTKNSELKHHPLHPVILTREQNNGFAWANNILMKEAFNDKFRYVVLLNNDTTVDPNFLQPLLHQLQSTVTGLVCPKIYFYPQKEFYSTDYTEEERGKAIWYMGGVLDWANLFTSHEGVNEVDHGQFTQKKDTDFATGCCIALSKTTADVIGPMNEKYFLYYEDVDWSIRAKQAGLKVVVEPKSIIYHKNAGSSGGSGSKFQQYYQTRNRFNFGMQYAPLRTKLHLIKNALIQLSGSNPTIRTAARDAFLCRMGPRNFPK